MKIRFTTSIADVRGWSYDFGEVADVPEEAARKFIRDGKAIEVSGQTCPNCGHQLIGEPEAAALASAGERPTMPGARKRG